MSSWLREDHREVAFDRLLDAAAVVFRRAGVRQASMAEIATEAGCSRATLYRYFEGRDQLLVAYVNREALRVAALLGPDLDALPASRRGVEGVLRAVDAVRSSDALSLWFEGDDLSEPLRLAGHSEVVGAITAATSENRVDAQLAVRLILSLLSMPGSTPEEERALVERALAGSS